MQCIQRSGIVTSILMCLSAGATLSGATTLTHAQTYSNGALPPMTFEVVTRDFSPTDGTALGTERSLRAIRGDGSTAEIRNQNAGGEGRIEVRLIEDAQSRRRAMLMMETRTVTSMPLPADAGVGVRPAAKWNCGLEDGAIRREVDGYPAIQDVRQPASSGLAVSSERWLAPDLGCIAVRTTWKVGDTIVKTEQVENIRRGEPDASLFVIPDGFEEVPPAEATRRLLARTGRPAGSGGDLMALVEQRYHELRAR